MSFMVNATRLMNESPLVLLAEDRASNVEPIHDYLSGVGYRLIVAANGIEAIALAKAQIPQVILMDIQMPGMDGLEAIERIQQEPTLNKIPIIALTALDLPRDRERCLAAGATEYLTKPVKLKYLVQVIKALLEVRLTGSST
jgi:CheY-like chemotaxis protein